MTSTLYPVQLVMIGFAVAYFLFEIFLNVNDVKDDTSNVILFNWTRKRRMIFIPFTLGAVGGHLFLGTENEYFGLGDGTLPVLVLLGVIVLLVLAGIFLLRKDFLLVLVPGHRPNPLSESARLSFFASNSALSGKNASPFRC